MTEMICPVPSCPRRPSPSPLRNSALIFILSCKTECVPRDGSNVHLFPRPLQPGQ